MGVNKYRLEKEDPLEVLMIDNQQVYRAQCDKLAKLRAERDPAAVKRALAAVTEAARSREGNLLQRAVSRGGGNGQGGGGQTEMGVRKLRRQELIEYPHQPQ